MSRVTKTSRNLRAPSIGSYKFRASLGAMVFLVPALVGVFGLVFLPLAQAFVQSLNAAPSGFSAEEEFVGLANYTEIISDEYFATLLLNSFSWTFFVVVGQNLLGFALALIFNAKWRLSGLLRAIVVLPWVLPGVVAAILWRFMYDPQLGLVASVLQRVFGEELGRAQLLADPDTALIAVIIAGIWKGFPFAFLLYLAGLQNVDRSQVEAAVMDGANFLRIVQSVIIPALRPVIVLTLLLTAIFTFNYFDMIWVMTKGGPLGATHIFPTYIFQTGFGQFNFELAAAYGVFGFGLLLLLLLPYLRHSLRNEREED